MISDCHMRQISISRYVSFQDLDEFIVPQDNRMTIIWHMLNAIDRNNSNFAGLCVGAQYFTSKTMEPLVSVKTWEDGGRTDFILGKCIIRPERVFEQGIHHVSRVVQD